MTSDPNDTSAPNDRENRKLVLYAEGDAFRSQNSYDEATEKYQEALAIDPEYADAYNGLGNVLLSQGRYNQAIERYRKAVELWEKDPSEERKRPLCNWARALHFQKHFDEAADKYREALSVDPEYPVAYNGLGALFADQGRFDDAIEQYQKADDLWRKDQSKTRKHALRNWADALRSQNHYDESAKKCQEAIAVDPDYPDAYNSLGAVLADQGRFDDAIEKFRKADELWQKTGSKNRRFALWNWGWALHRQERFEDAVAKYALAAKIEPEDATLLLDYGNGLADLGRYRDAIAQLEKASSLDPDDPLPRHNKADFLFQLGRYEDGWKAWRAAWQCYERKLKEEPWNAEQLRLAVYFAGVLRDIFKYYEKAKKHYRQVLEQQDDNADACAGLAILYQQWADSDTVTPEIHAQLNYQVGRAVELLKRQLDNGCNFETLLSLADLHIETKDWALARERLELAEFRCGDSRLKRAEVTRRQALVCLGTDEHAEAVKNFRQTLLVKPGDLALRGNLGNALLKSKQFEAAQDEFARVLKLAEGNIDALLGAAQVSIELADDGDPDQYQIAEQYLNDALKYGRNQDLGSKHLQKSEIAKIYYMRGYARTKSYEAGAVRVMPLALVGALSDFRQCKKLDPNSRKAPAAIEKITQRLGRGVRESWGDVFGPLVIFAAAAAVFLFAQLDFFFEATAVHKWLGLPWPGLVKDVPVYSLLTFGSLLFMIAGIYLPKVLKLKVGGIELEKASVDHVSAPSTLGISRSGSLTS